MAEVVDWLERVMSDWEVDNISVDMCPFWLILYSVAVIST